MTVRVGAWLAFCLLAAHGAAQAHTRSESYSRWTLGEDSLTGTITIPLREVMLLYQGRDASTPPRELFLAEARASTRADAAGNPCVVDDGNVLQAASGFVSVELRFACSGPPDRLRYRSLFEAAPAHVNYARVYRDGAELGEKLFTDTADSWDLASASPGGSATFVSFLQLGIEHIAGGIDHVAFLCGLLLVAGSAGRSILAVTGFTLGHSASLAAAVLGYVGADGRLVEAFIGFTVAIVALEYFLLSREAVWRYAIGALVLATAAGALATAGGLLPARAMFAFVGIGVFSACYLVATGSRQHAADGQAGSFLLAATACFGLVHGFGFAGFLMDTGLLGGALFVPLLGFNLGVEAGQLIIVAAALLASAMVRERLPRFVPDMVAAGLCGTGLFWFLGRTLG